MHDNSTLDQDFDTSDFTEKLYQQKIGDQNPTPLIEDGGIEVSPETVLDLAYGKQINNELQNSELAFQKQRERFVMLYGEDFLKHYVKRWILGVFGGDDCISIGLCEKPAIKDYFEAMAGGRHSLVDRAIEIGITKRV